MIRYVKFTVPMRMALKSNKDGKSHPYNRKKGERGHITYGLIKGRLIEAVHAVADCPDEYLYKFMDIGSSYYVAKEHVEEVNNIEDLFKI